MHSSVRPSFSQAVTTGLVIEVLESALFSSCRGGWSDIDHVREIAEASKVTGGEEAWSG
jgi:hypothetical protein